MEDYKRVEEALSGGAEPEMLCATCPWDRLCVQPPEQTKEDYEREQAKSKAEDEVRRNKALAEGKDAPLPVGTLLTALTMAGRDRMGKLCPVFSIRLRSADGRALSDNLKAYMQERA